VADSGWGNWKGISGVGEWLHCGYTRFQVFIFIQINKHKSLIISILNDSYFDPSLDVKAEVLSSLD